MTIAKRLKMTDGEFAFVTVDLKTDLFYTNGKWTGYEGPGTQFAPGLNGILDLSVERPVLSKSFQDRYKEKVSSLPSDIQALMVSNVST